MRDETRTNDLPCLGRDTPALLTNQAARAFGRRMDQALRPHGISFAQLANLMLLERDGPLLQRDLVRGSPILQPAMVAALAKLETVGLVIREQSAEDRRAATVTLTDKGRRLVALAAPTLEEVNAGALAGFSPEEVNTLVNLLGRLIANLMGRDSTKDQL